MCERLVPKVSSTLIALALTRYYYKKATTAAPRDGAPLARVRNVTTVALGSEWQDAE